MAIGKPSLYSKAFDRITLQDRINFARHLSLVIKAGLPIYNGLAIIKEQTESKILKTVIDSLILDVNNGKFLADGLQKYEHLFGNFFINIVRVGESSGTLAKNLLYLADELKRSQALRTKVRSAMVYPIVILIATLAVAGFLTFYIFPKLIPVFAGLNVSLPLTTRIMLWMLSFGQDYGLYILGAIIAVIIAMKVIMAQVRGVRYFFDLIAIHAPVLSSVIVDVNMVNFSRVLSLLLKSGVKIVEALTITSATFNNEVYHDALAQSEDTMRKGGELGTYLAAKPGLFPPLVSGMVKIGETTGNLEDNLEYLAEYYDDEVDVRLHSLTSLIEPLMLMFMGLLVGFVALSIITPIYSISQGLSK
jgi:type IV pilus assembly protein PilC